METECVMKTMRKYYVHRKKRSKYLKMVWEKSRTLNQWTEETDELQMK